MTTVGPFNFSLRASNNSIVRGCPGVPRSFPRIEGMLEIRSNNGLPVLIRSIAASLGNSQVISIPSSSGIGSSNASRNYTLYTSRVYSGMEEVLGLDVPFVIPITQDVISSGEVPKYSLVNSSCVNFVVTYGNKTITETSFEFPVPIKKYNTLPIYRQFIEPGIKRVDSADRIILLEYSMPNLSVGPGDLIEMRVKLSMPSTFNKKVKLKKLYLELREIIEFHDGGFQDKVNKIAFTQQEFSNTKISSEGVKFNIGFACPSSNPWNEMTEIKEGTEGQWALKSNKTLGKINPNVPLSHVQGFSVIGKLFSIRYELYLKVKLSGAKDMELRQQLILSPFDAQNSVAILKWIMNECDLVAKSFGSNFESNLDATVKRAYAVSGLKLTTYKANSVDDWVKLGLGERAVKTHGKLLDYYID